MSATSMPRACVACVSALLALATLSACGPDVRPMTLSPADARARRRYTERGEEERSPATSGEAATGLAEAPAVAAPEPSPPPEPVEASGAEADLEAPSYGGAYGGAGGGATSSEIDVSLEAAPSRAPLAADDSDVHARSVESLATSSGSSTGATSRLLNIGAFTTIEPLPWVPLDPAPLPAGPRRVLLASLELPPGLAVFPPSSSCQDVLLFVAEGVLVASGTGIGTLDAPATLYPGDAVRFGPEGDARVENTGSEIVRATLAIARREGTGAPLYTVPDEAERCPEPIAPDPLVRPMRVAHRATAAPLVVSDGHLEVRILLDADGSGAMHAGLAVLEGDPETRVAPHVHDAAAELLFIEEGEGTMTIGERTLAVRPGIVVYVPEGVVHSFEPTGARPLVALQVYAPSGPEQRFRGMTDAR